MTGSLSTIVRSLKSATTNCINDLRKTPGGLVSQRNYYEHVIRNEQSLNRIREYLAGNPARWDVDREKPAAATPEEKDAWFICKGRCEIRATADWPTSGLNVAAI